MSVPCDAQFACWHPQHFIKQEFLATSIRFELRKNAFNDPRLIRLFNALSDELHVFYSEIRRTECPVRAWFWRGLPPGPVDAFCLGGPYPALWPEAAISAVTLPGGTLSVTGSRIAPDLPEPPGKLIAPDRPFDPRSRDRARYADGFPFTILGT